jgi:hypothetical protein
VDAVTPDLEQARQRLYQSFSRYPARVHAPHCKCDLCSEDFAHTHLLQIPLDQLSESVLLEFLIGYICQLWGNPQDFKHLFPRLIDDAIVRVAGYVDSGWLGQAISRAKLSQWPQAEQDSTFDFLSAALLAPPVPNVIPGTRAERIVQILANADINPLPYLDRLLNQPTSDVATELSGLIKNLILPAFWQGRLKTPPFRGDPAQRHATPLLTYFTTSSTLNRIESLALSTDNAELFDLTDILREYNSQCS